MKITREIQTDEQANSFMACTNFDNSSAIYPIQENNCNFRNVNSGLRGEFIQQSSAIQNSLQGTSSIGFTEELNQAMVEKLRDRNYKFYVNHISSPFTNNPDQTLQEITEDSLDEKVILKN